VTAALVDEIRLLPHVVAYEWRKATAFRLGFLLREILRGVGRSLVMAVVFAAMFRSSGVASMRGYTLPDIVHYLVWAAALQKVLTDEKSLDLAEQIFDGTITKYLVMPVSFFTLLAGRYVQFTVSQLAGAALFLAAGALLLPSWWPAVGDPVALLQALVLLLLGSACYLLVHFILNGLAFWLDVVWSLLNMFRFVAMFVSGAILPVPLMPHGVQQAFAWLFPYWTLCAPAELLLGRMGTAGFLHGLVVQLGSLLLLSLLSSLVWRRGLARYCGVGA